MQKAQETPTVKFSNLNKELKLVIIGYISVLVVGLAFVLGPAFITLIYMGIAAAAVAAFAMYPKETEKYLQEKQLVILGAALGFFMAGPLGLVLGGWLVDFVVKQAGNIKSTAQSAHSTVKSYVSPTAWLSGMWTGVKQKYTTFIEVLDTIEPNFTYREESDEESPASKTSEQSGEIEELLSPQPSQTDESVKKQALEVNSGGLVNWFWNTFAIIPPVVPPIEPTDNNVEKSNEPERTKNLIH